jgi:pimeloyl-ACP methyl ester carboxylesterase
MTSGDDENGATSCFVTAPDGLKLHVRAYGARTADTPPIVCLPGLARTSVDFHDLARAFASDRKTPAWVLALDYRGRGRSDYDRNPLNYNLAVELSDLCAVLTALEVGPAVFVGTSRGGLLTMLLAVAQPAAVAGAVLNDIGPVIEPKGLVRIKSYVGKLPLPKSFEDGAEILRRLFDAQFPKLDADDWLAYAHRTWDMRDAQLVPTYDVGIAQTMKGIDIERPLPALWNEFDALAKKPLMAIRGANSDVLSEATLAAMQARCNTMTTLIVPDQGHAPLLREPDVIRKIVAFAAGCGDGRSF